MRLVLLALVLAQAAGCLAEPPPSPSASRAAVSKPAERPTSQETTTGVPLVRLRLLDDVNLPSDLLVAGTRFGGISALAYEAPHFLALSDGRGRDGPPRLYRLSVTFDEALAVKVEEAVLLDSGGAFDPQRFDPEGLAVVPRGWLIASEGDGHAEPRLGPAIDLFDRNGRHRQRLELPSRFSPTPSGQLLAGTRPNRGLEGLSSLADGTVVAAMEEALVQDGPPPSQRGGTCLRMLRFEASLRPSGELAYCTDPLPPGDASSSEAGVGVSAVELIDSRRLLVLERATVRIAGAFVNRVRIYQIDPSTAPAVGDAEPLPVGAAAEKRLVIDLAAVVDRLSPPTLDNFESLALGPRLPSGERLLLVASDDNFKASQRTAFLAFALAD